jgi:hypothetical protein
MKKIWLIFLGVVFVSSLAIFWALNSYLDPKLKALIETEGSKALGAPLTVESAKISLWPPVSLSIENLEHKRALGQELKVKRASIHVPLMAIVSKQISQVSIRLLEPRLQWQMEPTASTDAKANAQAAPPAGVSELNLPTLPFGVSIEIENGDFSVNLVDKSKPDGSANAQYGLAPFNGSVKIQNYSEPISIAVENSKLKVNHSKIKFTVPIEIQSQWNLDLENFKVSTKNSKAQISAIALDLSGHYDIQTSQQSWQVSTNISDLSKLPELDQWKGALVGQGKVDLDPKTGPKGEVLASFKQISGPVNHTFEKTSAKGSIFLDGQVKLSNLSGLTANTSLKFDFSKLALEQKDLFVKPAGSVLSGELVASIANNNLNISQSSVVFDKLQAQMSGSVAMAAPYSSNLKISIPKTQLAGFEKFSPLLKDYGIAGELELEGVIQGPLTEANQLSVSLKPLKLQNFKAGFKYAKDDLKMDGPVSGNLVAQLQARGTQLQEAQLDLSLNLSQLSITKADMFSKPKNEVLDITLTGRKMGAAGIQLQKSRIKTTAGDINITGTIQQPQSPILQLVTDTSKFNLSQLSNLVPMLKKQGLSGTLDAKLNWGGRWDFAKGVEGSPVTVSGNINVKMPQYTMKSEAEESPSAPAKEGATKTAEKLPGP